MHLDIYTPRELPAHDRRIIEQKYGALDYCDFIVYFRKHTDYAGEWDGAPIRGERRMVKVDEPDNWKNTWFLFFHS